MAVYRKEDEIFSNSNQIWGKTTVPITFMKYSRGGWGGEGGVSEFMVARLIH